MFDDTATTPAANPVVRHDDTVALLAGIIADFQDLVVQQIRLTRQELTANLEMRWAATAILLTGAALGFQSLRARDKIT